MPSKEEITRYMTQDRRYRMEFRYYVGACDRESVQVQYADVVDVPEGRQIIEKMKDFVVACMSLPRCDAEAMTFRIEQV